MEETPKIIVDDDWKSQAQAEKAKIAEQQAQDAEQAAANGGGAPGGLPEQPGFIDLVRMMATQALMYLGAFPDPQTGKAIVALDMAKLHIDLLGVVEEKSKGNLSEDEQKAVAGTLHELRIQFVEITKAVEQAAAEGTLQQMPAAGAPAQMPEQGG